MTEIIVRNYKILLEKNGFWEKLHKYNYAFVNKLWKGNYLMGILPKIERKNWQNARKTAGFGDGNRFDKPQKLWNNCAVRNEFDIFSFCV
ncbi:MAG: hypothetical protein PUJ55_05245 [Clostridiales bacterium]|nr:hypothetical protein [Clostridiales bacterium]